MLRKNDDDITLANFDVIDTFPVYDEFKIYD